MGIVPDSNEGKIQFFQSKTAPWGSAAAQIGTTPAAVTAMGVKVTAAQAKLAAAVSARAAAKTATAELDAAIYDMGRAGADIIKQIRAKAAVDGDNVYFLAQIPAPAKPTPIAAPGTPTNFTAALLPDGSLKLRWKCPNPSGSQGTIYQLSRRTGAAGEYSFVGATGARWFVDPTVPAGVAAVTYRLTAVRSTVAGTAAEFTVNFGVGGGGAVTASVAAGGAKLAA